MNLLSVTPEVWLQNEKEFADTLTNDCSWNSVPLLNVNEVQDLQDKKLIRFRGMIQDMFNPEYYYEKYEIVNETTTERYLKSGKYVDMIECKDNEVFDEISKKNVTSERQTMVVISFPGLNKWVENIEIEKYKISTISNESCGTTTKRSLDDDDTTVSNHIKDQPNCSNTKKLCTALTPLPELVVSREHLLNFPLPEAIGKACHVKIYSDLDKLKLNDMIDAVGFLSLDPVLTEVERNNCDNEMEIQTHNPPPSLVPRLHCVAWKKVEYSNPLVGESHLDEEKMRALKKELQIVLAQLFVGDALAAEYFIYHLISRIYLRTNLLPLGKLTLNISHIPSLLISDYGEQLYKFIELLVPKSHYFPMSLESMNEAAFTPKKDYECDRITSGLLQLSDNTHLVLDETKLSAGRLNECGVRGVAAISNAIKNQKTSYDFNYFPMEFDCDIPFLILSEGKSLLGSDFHIILKPDETCVNTFSEILEAARHFLKPELLKDLRIYLTLARHGKYELGDDVQQLIQDDFVQMRQTNSSITADDLHQLLVIARLICLSEGKTALDVECWKQACALEKERKNRLKS